jgi:hypothetical protein
MHEIFFAGVHKELYKWLARLEDTQFEIRSIPPMVWTATLIKKFKKFNNVVSRAVDLLFDIIIGGYINEFSIDKVESYSQEKRYLFKVLFALFSLTCEQKVSAYMPSWSLLVMTAVW